MTADERESPVSALPGRLSRRQAVKTLGIAPVLALIGLTACDMERAADRVAALAGRNYSPLFFSSDEWRTVRLLVDYIIPRDDRSGSATDAKAPEFMDLMLADDLTSDAAREAVRSGLEWLDSECRSRSGNRFEECSDEQRRAVLDDIAWPGRARPEMVDGVAFFTRMRDMTASAFFSSEMGWNDLQYIGHTFVTEWNGCPPAALEKLGVSYDLMAKRVNADDRQ